VKEQLELVSERERALGKSNKKLEERVQELNPFREQTKELSAQVFELQVPKPVARIYGVALISTTLVALSYRQ